MSQSMQNFKKEFPFTQHMDKDVIERLFQSHKKTLEKIEKNKYILF